MELSANALALLEDVRQARASRRTIVSRGGARGVDLASAYAIQAALGEGVSVKGTNWGCSARRSRRRWVSILRSTDESIPR